MRLLRKRSIRVSKCTPVELRRFIEAMAKLELTEFFGVARILNVPLIKVKAEKIEDCEMKQADEILEEIIDKYIEMNWYKRNNLYSIICRALEENELENKAEEKLKDIEASEGDSNA